MKKLGLLLGLVVMLAGCSGGKTTTTVCTMDNEMMKQEVSLESKEDEVTKQTMTIEVDTSLYGDTYTEEELEEMLKEIDGENIGNIKGVTFDVTVKDGLVKEVITIDHTKADMEELMDAMLVTGNDEDKKDTLSLKALVEEAEAAGATCKEK